MSPPAAFKMSPTNLASIGNDVLTHLFTFAFAYVPHNAVAQRLRLVCRTFDAVIGHRAPAGGWALLRSPARLAEATARNVAELQLRLRPRARRIPPGLRAPPGLQRLVLFVSHSQLERIASWLGAPPPPGLRSLHVYLRCVRTRTVFLSFTSEGFTALLRDNGLAAQLDELVLDYDRSWGDGDEPWILTRKPERCVEFNQFADMDALFEDDPRGPPLRSPDRLSWLSQWSTPPPVAMGNVATLVVCRFDATVLPPRRRLVIYPIGHFWNTATTRAMLERLALPAFASLPEWHIQIIIPTDDSIAAALDAMLVARRTHGPPNARTELTLRFPAIHGDPPRAPTELLSPGTVVWLGVEVAGRSTPASDWQRWIAAMRPTRPRHHDDIKREIHVRTGCGCDRPLQVDGPADEEVHDLKIRVVSGSLEPDDYTSTITKLRDALDCLTNGTLSSTLRRLMIDLSGIPWLRLHLPRVIDAVCVAFAALAPYGHVHLCIPRLTPTLARRLAQVRRAHPSLMRLSWHRCGYDRPHLMEEDNIFNPALEEHWARWGIAEAPPV